MNNSLSNFLHYDTNKQRYSVVIHIFINPIHLLVQIPNKLNQSTENTMAKNRKDIP